MIFLESFENLKLGYPGLELLRRHFLLGIVPGTMAFGKRAEIEAGIQDWSLAQVRLGLLFVTASGLSSSGRVFSCLIQ